MVPSAETVTLPPGKVKLTPDQLPDFDYEGPGDDEPKIHIITPESENTNQMKAFCGVDIGHLVDGMPRHDPKRCVPCIEKHNEWKASHL